MSVTFLQSRYTTITLASEGNRNIKENVKKINNDDVCVANYTFEFRYNIHEHVRQQQVYIIMLIYNTIT